MIEQPVKDEKKDSDKDASAEAAPKKKDDDADDSSSDEDEDADGSSSAAEKADKSGGAAQKAEDASTPAAAGDVKDEEDDDADDGVDGTDSAPPAAAAEKVKVLDDAEIKVIFDTVLVEIPADSSAFADAVAPHWVVETLTVAERVDSVSKELFRRLASRILHRLTPHELSEVSWCWCVLVILSAVS